MSDPKAKQWEAADQWARFNMDKAIAFATEALKACLVLHGGASVAAFSLMAASASSTRTPPPISLTGMQWALACFSAGLVATTLTLLAAYVAQLYYSRHVGQLDQKSVSAAADLALAFRFHKIGIALFGLSLALFVGGAWSAAAAFR